MKPIAFEASRTLDLLRAIESGIEHIWTALKSLTKVRDMGPDDIGAIRSFHRTVTERIGALNDEYLSRSRPLGASRVLWEIGDDGSNTRSLRSKLGLDSGYLSRLLRSLERDGLIELQPDSTDLRVRTVHLTSSGRSERVLLDQQSDELARSLLAPLNAEQQARLVDGVATVERLLTAGLVQLDVENPTSEAAMFCINSYFAELDGRFEVGFDPALSISADACELIEPAGLLLVARLRDEPVGCGALKVHAPGSPAEIKRMWVSETSRGLGLGRRILSELECRAQERGVTTIRLETNRTLFEAIRLYRTAGYEEVEAFNEEPFAHHWFEKRL